MLRASSDSDRLGPQDILQDEEVRQGLKEYSNWKTYPQLYVNGELIGGRTNLASFGTCQELVLQDFHQRHTCRTWGSGTLMSSQGEANMCPEVASLFEDLDVQRELESEQEVLDNRGFGDKLDNEERRNIVRETLINVKEDLSILHHVDSVYCISAIKEFWHSFDFPRLEQDLTVALRRQRASEEGSMELVEG
eukprot:g17827.t1